MAKTRAQRKAERRAREAEERKRSGERESPAEAQRETQTGVSGEVAEVEAVEAGIAAGAPESQLETPDAPKPRSARRAEAKAQKEAEKRKREQQKRHESEQLAKKQPALRLHRLPHILLAGAEEGPVARPRHAGPGHRGHHSLRRCRGRLPRRARRDLQ
jgi:hypothetical protein